VGAHGIDDDRVGILVDRVFDLANINLKKAASRPRGSADDARLSISLESSMSKLRSQAGVRVILDAGRISRLRGR